MKMKYTIDAHDKVVIGSGTIMESYFQIANFMNMLYGNIAQEHWAMTNKVIRHNIETYFVRINKNHLDKITDEVDKRLFMAIYDDVISNLDRLIEQMEQTYKMVKLDEKDKYPDIENLIKKMKESSYMMYEYVWSLLKQCYTEYKFIKNY